MRIFGRGMKYGVLKALGLCIVAALCFVTFRTYQLPNADDSEARMAIQRFIGSGFTKKPLVVHKGNVTHVEPTQSSSLGVGTLKQIGHVVTSVATTTKSDAEEKAYRKRKALMDANKKKMEELFRKWNGYKNVKMPRLFDPQNPPREIDAKLKQWTDDVFFQEPTYPPPIKYLMNNEHLCGQEPVDVIVYVHTTPDHHQRRNVIRETWGNTKQFKKVNMKVIFLLGVSVDGEKKLHDALKYEQAFYNDIIKGDFIDSYKNLTLKAIMGLQWIKTYCSQARYVLKSDDDILINIYAMLRYLYVDRKSDKRFIACYAWPNNGMHIFRDPNSCLKWCIDKTDLVGRDTYPRYCAGAGFVMTTDVALDLYNASQRHPFFWVDDAYLTGLLPRVVPEPVRHIHFDHLLTMHAPTADKAVLDAPIVKILVVMANNGGGEEKRALFWKSVATKKYPDLKDFGIE